MTLIKPFTPEELRQMYGDDPERILGSRLRALREDAGLTQAELAAKMTRQGFPMHQTTIGKIEAAQRPVSVNEGVRLAAILSVRLEDLLADPELDAEAAALREEMRQARARRIEIQAERASMQAQLEQLRVQLSESAEALRQAERDEREADRRYRVARLRSAGHSPAATAEKAERWQI